MSLKKLPALVCTMLLVFVLLAACSGESSESSFQGNWAYSYEPKELALLVKNGGKAKLDGKTFTYTEENGILRLENKAGDLAFAKFKNDDKKHIFLFKHTIYTGANNDGLIGKWTSGKWSFEFTAEGTFLEDGIFPGYYSVDEENSTIFLIYNDQFDNTIVPFELKGNKLTLDYPWEMVKKINQDL